MWLPQGGHKGRPYNVIFSHLLSRGEMVSRSDAFTSRSVTGEGSLAQFGTTSVNFFPSVCGQGSAPLPKRRHSEQVFASSLRRRNNQVAAFSALIGFRGNSRTRCRRMGKRKYNRIRSVRRAPPCWRTEVTPHPSRGGWRKRRRWTPQGRGP